MLQRRRLHGADGRSRPSSRLVLGCHHDQFIAGIEHWGTFGSAGR